MTPAFLWRGLQDLAQWHRQAPFRVLERQGWVAARKDDFYSPLPVKERLLATRERWYRPSALTGVQLDVDAMRALWLSLHEEFGREYASLPPFDDVSARGFGVGFSRADARTLYYMLRRIRPRRYFEVGSGISTYYSHLSRKAAGGQSTQITCVEPFPYPALSSIDDIRLIRDEVQNVPVEEFDVLEAGDVLFIDSSHSVRLDSDVTYLMMEVVPRVKVGVYVHFHDIPFPYNFPYPPELYIFPKQWPMYWNEPVLVQAFLQFNDAFRVSLSLPYLSFVDPELIRTTVPERSSELAYANVVASLWLERVK